MTKEHWTTKLRKHNKELQEEVKNLRKEAKQQKKAGKSTDSKSGDDSKKVTLQKHRIRNLRTSIKEYETVITDFTKENHNLHLKLLELEEQNQQEVDRMYERLQKEEKRGISLIKVVLFLDRFLKHLPEGIIAAIQDDEGFGRYERVMKSRVLPYRNRKKKEVL